jgi:hypothetical protein
MVLRAYQGSHETKLAHPAEGVCDNSYHNYHSYHR